MGADSASIRSFVGADEDGLCWFMSFTIRQDRQKPILICYIDIFFMNKGNILLKINFLHSNFITKKVVHTVGLKNFLEI